MLVLLKSTKGVGGGGEKVSRRQLKLRKKGRWGGEIAVLSACENNEREKREGTLDACEIYEKGGGVEKGFWSP